MRNVCSIIVSRKISKRLKAVCTPGMLVQTRKLLRYKNVLSVQYGLATRPEDQFKIIDVEDLDDLLR